MPISDWVTCYSSLSPLYFHLLEALNIFLDACYEGCPLTVPIVGWLLHKKKDTHCQTLLQHKLNLLLRLSTPHRPLEQNAVKNVTRQSL